MKTYIMILFLFFSSLLADERALITDIWVYPDANSSITADNIHLYNKHFKKPDANSSFTSTLWVKVKIRDDVESGKYIVTYGQRDFDLSSFTPSQQMQKFTFFGFKRLSFFYDKERDSSIYYVRLLPTTATNSSFSFMLPEKVFFKKLDDFLVYLLIAGVVLGLIMMTVIYNGALYYFNREKSFLYYALMQVFMVGVLLFHTGIPQATSTNFQQNTFLYDYLSLFTAFFAVLFARSFLNTQQHLPYHDKILQLFLLFIMIDMLYYPKALIGDFGLYSLTTAYFVIIGFLRMRQGYKPAYYFVIGWSALVLGILVVERFEMYAYFDTMLLGSTIEAIMLAIALAHKIRQLYAEKEQQKELLIHQSKLASMGEMLENIAHQWRQPLTHLSYILMNIGEIEDKKARQEKVDEGSKQLEFMSHTIDDFKDFYAPHKPQEHFTLSNEVAHVLELVSLSDIKVTLDIKKDFSIYNYKNAFKQVLLNLLVNAKEALVTREIEDSHITIMIEKPRIIIEDNAGGIDTAIIHKIFEPYFTTKNKSSGIGLYMSKIIIEKNMQGSLRVTNSARGASFSIQF